MDIFVDISPEFAKAVDAQLIEQAVQTTIRQVASNQLAAGVSVSVVSSETVQQMNREYRGINAPTDVLSFENEADPDFPEAAPDLAGYLGDIAIAYPIAAAQAAAAGHTAMEEILLLAAHGTLHLLGFDHNSAAAKTKMWAEQQHILDSLNLSHILPTEN